MESLYRVTDFNDAILGYVDAENAADAAVAATREYPDAAWIQVEYDADGRESRSPKLLIEDVLEPSPPNTPTTVAELLDFIAEKVGEDLDHVIDGKENFEGGYDIARTGEDRLTVTIGDEVFVVRVVKTKSVTA